MAIQKAEAIVLRKIDFRETSIIVNFFTQEYGRIKGILKGIRGNPRKFASTLEPFSCNEIIFYPSRNSEIHLVSQCDLKENFNKIRSGLKALAFASYEVDLIDHLMPLEEKNSEVYELALYALRQMDGGFSPDKILRVFLIKLLKIIGFRPRLNGCISCNCNVASGAYFNSRRGGLLCPRCNQNDKYSSDVLRGTVASILHMERSEWQDALRLGLTAKVKEELDLIMHAFMEFHLQVRPKSKLFLENQFVQNYSAAQN